jgi:hypothetical protein
MTHEPEHHRDETDLQGLLRSVDLDTPNPDLAALNALRQRAANEFAQAAAAEGLTPPTAVSPIDSTRFVVRSLCPLPSRCWPSG